MKGGGKPLEELLEVGSHALTLKEIDYITSNDRVRRIYERRFPGRLHATILMSLTHKTYPEDTAEILWGRIRAHRDLLHRALGRDVGLSVATLDYLTNIRGTFAGPKIIEENRSSYVTRATTIDALTGLYLREVFEVVLKKEVHEADRQGSPLSLLMLDIDDFKRVNDRHGHPAGDAVLGKIGACLQESVREMDLAARYGGEELAVIMPDTFPRQAARIGERIRGAIGALEFDGFRVTVSIGVAGVGASMTTPEELIRAADDALYKAKRDGKNRVTVA